MKFLNPAALAAVCALALLFAAPAAHAIVGEPISGTSVGLDHDPSGIAVGPTATDGKGNVVFRDLTAGRYVVFLPDAAAVKAPVRIRFGKTGGAMLRSAAILPGRGKVYALDAKGNRLVVTVGRAGGSITVNVSIFDRWATDLRPPDGASKA